MGANLIDSPSCGLFDGDIKGHSPIKAKMSCWRNRDIYPNLVIFLARAGYK